MVYDPDVSDRGEHRKFYRTIKGLPLSRDDFLSDEATGSLPPRNADKVRYWRGFSPFDTLEQARAIAQRSRSQSDFIAEMMITANGAIIYERWGKNPGHHTLWGDPDECLARVTNVFPVFPAAEEPTDDDAF
jgi:hypothetical protein